jgi:hypothetical protein
VNVIVIANTLAYHKTELIPAVKHFTALCAALWEIIHEKKI